MPLSIGNAMMSISGSESPFNVFWFLMMAWSLINLLPSLGLIWRRLHDIGKAGGWYFLWLIPLVGGIILIVWFCNESEPKENRFGQIPNLVH